MNCEQLTVVGLLLALLFANGRAQCTVPHERPTQEDYMCEVKTIYGFGSRLAGTPGQENAIEHIKKTLIASGFVNVTETKKYFKKWEATNWSLVLHTGTGGEQVPVAFPWQRSGLTPDNGLTYPLGPVHGTGEDRIAVTNGTFDDYNGLIKGANDEGCSMGVEPDPENHYDYRIFVPPLESEIKGLICCLDRSQVRLEGEYAPMAEMMSPHLPTLLVSSEFCPRVKIAQQNGASATLTMVGTYGEASTSTVIGVLPGRRLDEYIMLVTHTDGPTAPEEDGIAVMLTWAKYLAHRANTTQLEYSVIFLAVTGHMENAVPDADTWGFCNLHRDLMAKVKLAVDVEHLGSVEVHADNLWQSSGRPSPFYVYSSTQEGLQSLQQTSLGNKALTNAHFDIPKGWGNNNKNNTPPHDGSAVGLRPSYSWPPYYCNVTTVAGVTYPLYYLNRIRGTMDMINGDYLHAQATGYLEYIEMTLNLSSSSNSGFAPGSGMWMWIAVSVAVAAAGTVFLVFVLMCKAVRLRHQGTSDEEESEERSSDNEDSQEIA